MHNLYTCTDPTPFPASEYGGLFIISAVDEAEAIKILYDLVQGDELDLDVEEKGYTEGYIKQCLKHIGYAKDVKSGIVDSFTT